MTLVSPQQSNPGETIEASDVNNPVNQLAAAINGNLDSNNIASLTGTKITSATLPGSAFDATTRGGWIENVLAAPNTVTANGQRSYDLVFNSVDYTSVLSPGMRLKLTRTSAAPTQCTDLESGSTQYYSKSSPAAMTFTDDFVVSAWIKLESYAAMDIASRYNGTSGWRFNLNSDGTVRMIGYNAGAANHSYVLSYQSVPLNRWVHVSAQLDMSAFTATSTTSFVMIDGVDVPASVVRAGTNPVALVQAGNLEIGSTSGGGSNFDGKIAQVAIYNAKVTQATIRASIHQALTGSETSLISAYSFNNAITDLNTTNANNLTANGGAVATSADSPFSVNALGTATGTTDYAIVTKVAFSTNTTVTVQVPEGNTIPTSGGVSAIAYSTWKAPFGLPMDGSRWRLASLLRQSISTTSNATYGSYSSGGWALTVPTGGWDVGWRAGSMSSSTTTSVYFNLSSTALTGLTDTAANDISPFSQRVLSSAAALYISTAYVQQPQSLSAPATYVMYSIGATTAVGLNGTTSTVEIFAEFGLL